MASNWPKVIEFSAIEAKYKLSQSWEPLLTPIRSQTSKHFHKPSVSKRNPLRSEYKIVDIWLDHWILSKSRRLALSLAFDSSISEKFREVVNRLTNVTQSKLNSKSSTRLESLNAYNWPLDASVDRGSQLDQRKPVWLPIKANSDAYYFSLIYCHFNQIEYKSGNESSLELKAMK